jgi:uncharacterized protein YcnI
MRILIGLTALCLTAAAPAFAHIMLAEPHAASGSHYAAFFRVGHGCDGKATTALRIEVPVNVTDAKPQPKPGWTLKIEHAPLAQPITVKGKEIRERVSAVTWQGHLADDAFDQFGLLVHLPDATGTLYFPVIQSCGKTELRWIDIPSEGQSVEHPAPGLHIGGDDMAGMEHMHH